MPKPKHNKALLRNWLARARHADVMLVSASIADATSLRNALYHLQRTSLAPVRIERSGRRLILRAPHRVAGPSINAKQAKLTSTHKEP